MEGQLIEAKTAEDYQRIKRERSIAEHPASGNAEKQAEEAAMNDWVKKHNTVMDKMVNNPRNRLISRMLEESVTIEQQVEKRCDRCTGEQLARNLEERVTLAESEVESQQIAEERRIWRQNV